MSPILKRNYFIIVNTSFYQRLYHPRQYCIIVQQQQQQQQHHHHYPQNVNTTISSSLLFFQQRISKRRRIIIQPILFRHVLRNWYSNGSSTSNTLPTVIISRKYSSLSSKEEEEQQQQQTQHGQQQLEQQQEQELLQVPIRVTIQKCTIDPNTGIVTVIGSTTTGSTSKKTIQQQQQYQIKIGLEIHAQINTATKLFSLGQTGFLDSPINNNNDSNTSTNSTIRPNDGRSTSRKIVPYDVGVPGYLPIVNMECIHKALLTSVALNTSIQLLSRFERKHYNYPDLVYGYQITQQRYPIAINGYLQYNTNSTSSNSNKKKKKLATTITSSIKKQCRIERIQLEHDTGKTTTTTTTSTRTITGNTTSNIYNIQYSNIDYNRSGIGLLEIVTYPDLYTINDTINFITTLKQLLKHINVCTCKMELGQYRIDANINLISYNNNNTSCAYVSNDSTDNQQQKLKQQQRLTGRVEVKNLNSIQQVFHSIQYEAIRQAKNVFINQYKSTTTGTTGTTNTDAGSSTAKNPLLQEETRTWDVKSNQTILLRKKDQSVDYRFLPEPDIPPIVLSIPMFNNNDTTTTTLSNTNTTLSNKSDEITKYIRQHLMPELPNETIQRFIQQYNITEYQATVITSFDSECTHYFDTAIQYYSDMLHENHNDNDTKNTTVDTNVNINNNNTIQQQTKYYNDGIVFITNIICNELFALIKEYVVETLQLDEQDAAVAYSTVSSKQISHIAYMVIVEGSINKTIAKQLLRILFTEYNYHENYINPKQIILERNMELITDNKQLHELVQTIITIKCIDDVPKYYNSDQRTKNKIIQYLIGQSMIVSNNRAQPELLHDILVHELSINNINNSNNKREE